MTAYSLAYDAMIQGEKGVAKTVATGGFASINAVSGLEFIGGYMITSMIIHLITALILFLEIGSIDLAE